MRTRSVMFGISVLAALALAAPGAADHNVGPCNTQAEPGQSEFARHHVVPVSQSGMPASERHHPGMHRGFSFCAPSENRP